jgi:hypothetical protein
MASRRFSPDDDTNSRDECSGDRRLHRYRLIVLAGGVGEVVESAGGFLFDRARAGWDVRVLLDGPLVARRRDLRPLFILGIAAQDLDTDVGAVLRRLPRGGALAVGAEILARDAGVRADVMRVATGHLSEVTVWGGSADTGQGLESAAHPLSTAARAFKAQALRATGLEAQDAGIVAPTEPLFRLRGQSFRRLHSV